MMTGTANSEAGFDHGSPTLRGVESDRSAHQPDPVAHARKAHPLISLALQSAAIVSHANHETGEHGIAQAWRLDRRLELQRGLDPRGAGMAKCVGHRLLHEAIRHQARALA